MDELEQRELLVLGQSFQKERVLIGGVYALAVLFVQTNAHSGGGHEVAFTALELINFGQTDAGKLPIGIPHMSSSPAGRAALPAELEELRDRGLLERCDDSYVVVLEPLADWLDDLRREDDEAVAA